MNALDAFSTEISERFGSTLEGASLSGKVRDDCKKMLLNQSDKITAAVRNGSVSARRVCLNALKENAEQNVVSGDNHIYRGVLSSWGRVYFDLYKWVLVKFKEDGIITEDIMQDEIQSVEHDIKNVG